MAGSFFFYDLETSGFNPREQRIMQFAGQRVDLDLRPIDEPHNYLIKLTDDVLPDPDAVLLTGITPQATLTDGLSEAEFLKVFYDEICTSDTIFLGYNSIRFDDEFMRYLLYRNFYDAYEWQWRDGCGRWDLLDVVRMTRALRPDGVKWPFDSNSKPTNRLELLTGLNGLDHVSAHDALSDVQATIAVARLIKNKQPKLFEYMLGVRDKKKIATLVDSGQPFVYTSGKYPSEFQKTTVVTKLADHPGRSAALVYDLRHDPTEFLELAPEQLVERWRWQKEPDTPRLPIKTLRFNVCPAIAPLSVLDAASEKRLQLSPATVQAHLKTLQTSKGFVANVLQALQLMDKERQTKLFDDGSGVDGQLYDGFVSDSDKTKMSAVRAATPDDLATMVLDFDDQRLMALLPLYKARNFPKTLDDDERQVWEKYRERKLLGGGQSSRLARYLHRLSELDTSKGLSGEQHYIVEELQQYAQSIMPVDLDA